MSNIKNHLVVASATLLILTIAATNIVQIKSIVFAQNFDVNQKIKEIQTQFPLLSQNSSVKDVIHKVQGLDKDQALKTLAAFHILRNLQEYQALGSAGVSNNSTG
ncbi:MAG TPA: hypothetical protein VIY08_10030 [Candidatus Nitrosocosmicus sp.]